MTASDRWLFNGGDHLIEFDCRRRSVWWISIGLKKSVFPLIRLTRLSISDQVNFYLIYRVISKMFVIK